MLLTRREPNHVARAGFPLIGSPTRRRRRTPTWAKPNTDVASRKAGIGKAAWGDVYLSESNVFDPFKTVKRDKSGFSFTD